MRRRIVIKRDAQTERWKTVLIGAYAAIGLVLAYGGIIYVVRRVYLLLSP